MSLAGILLLFILVVLFAGGFTGVGGGPFYGTGHWGGSGMFVVIIVVLVLILSGRV